MFQRLLNLVQRPAVINIGALFSGSSSARLLSAVYIFILARRLGVDAFGVYAATLSLAKLSSVFFSLGLDSWLLRNGPRNQDRFDAAIGASLFIKGVLGLVWFGLLVGASSFLNQDVFPNAIVMTAALAVWAEDVTNLAWSAFKAALRNRITVWLMVSAQLLVLFVLLLLLWTGTDDVQHFMLGRMVAFIIGGTIAFAMALRHFGLRIVPGEMGSVIRETIPFGLSHGLATIYGRADITIIAFVLGKTAAGLYGPAVSLTTTLFLVPLTLYEVMLPFISRAYAQGRSITRLIIHFSWASLFIGVVLGLATMILAYPLVWLIYGVEFMASGQVLVVLSGVVVLKCLSFALAAVLAAVGWQGRRVWIQAVTAAFNIVATLLAVGAYGIVGVAHVYVLTEFFLMVGYLYLLLRWQQQPVPVVQKGS